MRTTPARRLVVKGRREKNQGPEWTKFLVEFSLGFFWERGSPFLCICYLFFSSLKYCDTVCGLLSSEKTSLLTYLPEGNVDLQRERGNTRILPALRRRVQVFYPSARRGRDPHPTPF